MIKLVKVSKRFNKKLFSNFSYIFNKGKIYSIIGPSGCGKSTLLSMIANKIKRYSGSIYYKDIDIKTLKNYTFESIGYVYQDYQLFDNLTGLENITLYFKLKGLEFDTKHGINFDILDDEAYAEEYLKEDKTLKVFKSICFNWNCISSICTI